MSGNTPALKEMSTPSLYIPVPDGFIKYYISKCTRNLVSIPPVVPNRLKDKISYNVKFKKLENIRFYSETMPPWTRMQRSNFCY